MAESRSGTFPQITFDSISYFPIILAPKSIQISFLNLISPFEKQINQNNLQSETRRDYILIFARVSISSYRLFHNYVLGSTCNHCKLVSSTTLTKFKNAIAMHAQIG